MAGLPGAWATCPAKTAGDWWAKIVTPALPELLVYSHSSPPPAIGVEIGPLKVAPRAALAWASVGQVAAPVVWAAVVVLTAGALVAAGAAVDEGGFEEVVVELLLLDPQPASASPAIRVPPVNHLRLFTVRTLALAKPYGVTSLNVPPNAVMPLPFPAEPVVTRPAEPTRGCSCE